LTDPLSKPDVENPYEDPICHAVVDPRKAFKSSYRGLTFYFDSKQCKREFDQNPQLWVSVSHAEMTSAGMVVD
jgi:YHS domain-containing protein